MTTVSNGRPSVGTSWLKGLLNTGNDSSPASPLKTDQTSPRRSVNFDLSQDRMKPMSSWINDVQGKPRTPSKSISFAGQIAQAQKSMPVSSWISGILSKTCLLYTSDAADE